MVKQMKKDGAAIDAIEVEITKLKEMRAALEAARAAVVPTSNEKAFNRSSESHTSTYGIMPSSPLGP